MTDSEKTNCGAAGSVEVIRLTHKESRESLTRLDAYLLRLDAKATTLLGFISGVSLFLATRDTNGFWKSISYLALLGSAVVAFLALAPRSFKDSPPPGPLAIAASKLDERAVLLLLRQKCINDYTKNFAVHVTKRKLWRAALFLFLTGVALTIATTTLGARNEQSEQSRTEPAGTRASEHATQSPTKPAGSNPSSKPIQSGSHR
ncbi:hypothetical protein [Winogradskya humida]|uniref:hypothetical protein n=1 Tax=Winogradskya humida TaxID=113566 RepID=UPI0019428733|nr:hypothetical protein [Actinoplanes humidus]